MIQDIHPAKLKNEYINLHPDKRSKALYFKDEKVYLSYDDEKKELFFPNCDCFDENTQFTYLFVIEDLKFFLVRETKYLPEGYLFYSMKEVRRIDLLSNREIFAVFSAYHLWKWYQTSAFCGSCGTRTFHDTTERALVCPVCDNRIYPRINPAVIVGVINGNRLLITRYRAGYKNNALVAGFTEFGETLEETVEREVFEETGLKVKNIRYYKSQPWGIAQDILAGFFCDVDGEDTIHMDESELKYAEWIEREYIELQPTDYSLTNEMMKIFKMGKEPVNIL